MALDSKDSDIEQLRCQISSLSVHSMESTSISSGNDLDMDDTYPGNNVQTLTVNIYSTQTHCLLVYTYTHTHTKHNDRQIKISLLTP